MTAGAKRKPRRTEAAIEKLQPSSPGPVPMGRLKRAPENVRKTNVAADVESLAEDIAAHGLLQSLIGYAGDTDVDAHVVYIVGGGRRLQALELLRAQSTINDDWPVPVLIRPVEEAIELSLSENLARRDMNPADEFVAFAALMAPGTRSPADLAKRFGFTERYVKQRLKLAGLIPEILDALRAGEMTLEAALAYGRAADQDVQRKVFKAQAKRGYDKHSPSSIRYTIDAESKTTEWPLYRFVGAEAYEREGGDYEDADLFGDEADAPRRLTDGQLIIRLAHDHLDFQMMRRLPEMADELELDHAAVTGFVKIKDLEFGQYYMAYHGIDKQAPDGYAWVGSDHDSGRVGRMLKTIRNNHILVQLPVGINGSGELVRFDKGFFVPKDQVRAIDPPAQQAGGVNWNSRSQAEIDAENRARDIRREAARAGVGSFDGTPLKDKAFWPRAGGFGIDAFKAVNDPDLGSGMLVALQVFVSDDQIEANLAEGERRLDERVAAEEARRAEKERVAAEKEAADEDRWKDLRGLDPAPEVLLTSDGDLWTKVDEGWTVKGMEEQVGYAEEFADLLEFFGPGDIQQWWMTRAEYEADQTEAAS